MPEVITFSNPSESSSAGFRPTEHDGCTLLVTGEVGTDETTTRHGEVEVAVPAELHCLTCGETWEKPWIFPAQLKNQMWRANGNLIGTLGHGEAAAGKSAPWCLFDATDEQKAAGVSFIEDNAPF